MNNEELPNVSTAALRTLVQLAAQGVATAAAAPPVAAPLPAGVNKPVFDAWSKQNPERAPDGTDLYFMREASRNRGNWGTQSQKR